MKEVLSPVISWLSAHGRVVIPLFLTVWMAWGDVRTRRIPNYLTFGTALAGLGFQLGFQGIHGLLQGLLGMALGLVLLLLFYARGGMGAGDVKALASVGTWLGPGLLLNLFVYMGISGGVMIIAYLAWHGLLWQKIRQAGVRLVNWILSRPANPSLMPSPPDISQGIPYAVALAAGMAILCWQAV